MKKLLLIEDRHKRQQLFSVQTGITLADFKDILDNRIEDRYNELLNEILQDNFDLSPYDIIISHKSAFGDQNTKVLKILEDHCRKHKKTLVLFSGGIIGNYYNREVYEVLELNSKLFYSSNLVLFLEAVKNGNENLLMLSYGKQWTMNIIMNVVERVNLYLDTEDKALFKYIDMALLEQIDIACNKIDSSDSKEEIEVFRDCLLAVVKDSIDE